MDAIEALDWGAYADFSFKSEKYPVIVPVMSTGVSLGNYVVIAILLIIALALYLAKKKYRSAIVALICFALSIGLIALVRFLVPRRRPENAERWLGPDAMQGSYPAASVFLFMLAMILIGFALWNWTENRLYRGSFVIVATLWTVWVCMSQMFLGLHFLTDILGAIVGATLMSWLAFKFMEKPSEPEASAQE